MDSSNKKGEKEVEPEEDDELSVEEEEYEQEIKNNNKNLISNKYSKRKPLKCEVYSELIKQMYKIINKANNRIKIPEKKLANKYDTEVDKYLKELEEKIKIMKIKYITTIIQKHFEKDKSKKLEIILKANIPKKRNEVKKCFNELFSLIKNNLEPQHQKYYYILILKMLKQYEDLSEKEIKMKAKEYKKNKLKKRIKEENKNENIDDSEWNVEYKQKRGYLFRFISFLIPIAFVVNYAYSNFKE